jgi:myo-inositol-1(or 4)-monophosphatase
MPDLEVLLRLAKSSVIQAGEHLLDGETRRATDYVHSLDHRREIKATADTIMEKEILRALADGGLPVLSEESGYVDSPKKSKYWFIVDPLDGTFNFVKGLGPSAICVALWKDQEPIFGVIYDLVQRQLVWGGRDLGAFAGDRRISVSDTSDQSLASICTGFPVRFDFENDRAVQSLYEMVRPYAKVRMLGSAAASLLHVARGSADVYSESGIMLWDIAAGIAIVDGAGGKWAMEKKGSDAWCYDVFVSNPALYAHRSGQS